MNKKRLKAIKFLANQLPPSAELVVYGEISSRNEIFVNDSGVEYEKPVRYKQKKDIFIPINHYKRLKKAYKRDEKNGVLKYIEWVDKNNLKNQKIFKDIEVERVNSQIMNIVKKGATNFWHNILIFMIAFATSFKTDKK